MRRTCGVTMRGAIRPYPYHGSAITERLGAREARGGVGTPHAGEWHRTATCRGPPPDAGLSRARQLGLGSARLESSSQCLTTTCRRPPPRSTIHTTGRARVAHRPCKVHEMCMFLYRVQDRKTPLSAAGASEIDRQS